MCIYICLFNMVNRVVGTYFSVCQVFNAKGDPANRKNMENDSLITQCPLPRFLATLFSLHSSDDRRYARYFLVIETRWCWARGMWAENEWKKYNDEQTTMVACWYVFFMYIILLLDFGSLLSSFKSSAYHTTVKPAVTPHDFQIVYKYILILI